jgi:hypothetical protein
MAATVQLRCYWKQLWSRWAITGSWEPLVLLPHIENIIFLHEEIRHFVSVCWVCATSFFYSLILRILYFYMKKSDILFLFVGLCYLVFLLSYWEYYIFTWRNQTFCFCLLGLCYLIFLLPHIKNIIFLHEEIRHFVSVCWAVLPCFFTLILRILYFYIKKSDILFLFVGSVLPCFFTPSYWEYYIFTWRNQTFCFCLLGLCYLVFLLPHIEKIIFLH